MQKHQTNGLGLNFFGWFILLLVVGFGSYGFFGFEVSLILLVSLSVTLILVALVSLENFLKELLNKD